MIIKPIESREWTGETSNRVSRPFALLGTFDRPHAYLSRLHSFYSPVRPERPSPLLLPPSLSLSLQIPFPQSGNPPTNLWSKPYISASASLDRSGTPQSRGAQPFALISAARFDRTAPRTSSSAAADWLPRPRFLSGEMAAISKVAKYKTTVKEPGIPGVLNMVICFALSIRFLMRTRPIHVLLLFFTSVAFLDENLILVSEDLLWFLTLAKNKLSLVMMNWHFRGPDPRLLLSWVFISTHYLSITN